MIDLVGRVNSANCNVELVDESRAIRIVAELVALLVGMCVFQQTADQSSNNRTTANLKEISRSLNQWQAHLSSSGTSLNTS